MPRFIFGDNKGRVHAVLLFCLVGCIAGSAIMMNIPLAHGDIAIVVNGLPPGSNWKWGMNLNDKLIFNLTANVPEWGNINATFMQGCRIDAAGVNLHSGINARVANLSLVGQIGSLNPDANAIIDEPDNDPYEVYVNFTLGFISLQDVVDSVLLPCVPLNNSALNMTWVGMAMLSNYANVENYLDVGMDEFTVIDDHTVHWINSTTDDFINCTFFDDGTLERMWTHIDYNALDLGDHVTMILNYTRSWNTDWFDSLDNCPTQINPDQKLYYRKSNSLMGNRDYIEYNITSKTANYTFMETTNQPAWEINATARIWNHTTWDPYRNDSGTLYGENTIGSFNDNYMNFNFSFGMAPIVYPVGTTGAKLKQVWSAFWVSQGFSEIEVGSDYLNCSFPDDPYWVYINVNTQGLLERFEVCYPYAHFLIRYIYELVSWPRDWFQNNYGVQLGETLQYNVTDAVYSASPSNGYAKIEPTAFVETNYLQSAQELLVPGTTVRANIFESPTLNGIYVYSGITDIGIITEGESIFSYLWVTSTCFVFPAGTTGEDLNRYCWWYHLAVNTSDAIIGAYSVSIRNATGGQFFNISVTPDGIVSQVIANCSFEDNLHVIHYINFSVDLLNYNAIPRAEIEVTGTAFDNATILSFSSGATVLGGETIQSYAWNFGDSGISGVATPTHRYATAGTYTVSLNVTDSTGNSIIVEKKIIVQPARASFTVSVNGSQFYTLEFVRFHINEEILGSYQVASYAWTFGDGETSSQATPIHRYNEADTYNVNLLVTMTNGDTRTAIYSVIILEPVVALLITKNATTVYAEDDIQFWLQISIEGPYTVAGMAWNFGDEQTSNDLNPIHAYSAADTYTITVVVSMTNGDSFTTTYSVTVEEKPALTSEPNVRRLMLIAGLVSLAIGAVAGMFLMRAKLNPVIKRLEFAAQNDYKKVDSGSKKSGSLSVPKKPALAPAPEPATNVNAQAFGDDSGGWDNVPEDTTAILNGSEKTQPIAAVATTAQALPGKCPFCGFNLPKPGAKFCGKCGQSLI